MNLYYIVRKGSFKIRLKKKIILTLVLKRLVRGVLEKTLNVDTASLKIQKW